MSDFGALKRDLTERCFRNTAWDLTDWRARFPSDVTATVVHIPARSGSTRIRDKNIREVCGLPLMAYSIRIAKALPGVDRVIVNTDSPAYAEIARQYGAETPFLRPRDISTSESNPYWAYYYLFRHLVDEDYPVKTIVTLAPTSPLRNAARLSGLMDILRRDGMVQSAFRVRTRTTELYRIVDGAPRRALLRDREGLTYFKPLGVFTGRHVFDEHVLRKHIDLVSHPLELVDIDTEADLRTLERVVRGGLYDFGTAL